MKTVEVVAAVIRSNDANRDTSRDNELKGIMPDGRVSGGSESSLRERASAILATQRGYGEFAGKWEFPGGKIEPGETPEQALVREIREELGAHIDVEKFLVTVDYDYPTFHLKMHCYICRFVEGGYSLHEHLAAKWLSENTLDLVDWLPADVIVVDAIREQKVLF